MNNEPMKMIEQYLERVKVYLPLASEETILEIRTHLIEEAENIGQGEITVSSVMRAIERFGDPKTVASEYTGTGRKIGPIPTEYTQPMLRILVVLIGLSLAFIIGAQVVGFVLVGFIGEVNYEPFIIVSIPIMIAVNVVFVLIVIRGLSEADRDRPPTEMTALESLLGIGTNAFRPKLRSDAAGEMIMGAVFGFVVLLPQIQVLYSPAFLPFVWIVATLGFIGAVKGALFFGAGENNLNLIFEAAVSVAWIIFALVLINIGWPLDYIYANVNGTWTLVDLVSIFTEMEIPFMPLDVIWSFIIFIIVVTNVWRVIVATMKVPMFLRTEKGLWWQGNWGNRRTKARHR